MEADVVLTTQPTMAATVKDLPEDQVELRLFENGSGVFKVVMQRANAAALGAALMGDAVLGEVKQPDLDAPQEGPVAELDAGEGQPEPEQAQDSFPANDQNDTSTCLRCWDSWTFLLLESVHRSTFKL